MGYPCSVPRLNYFSNPNVFFNGAPMGVDYAQDPGNAADNARSMNNTAPYVAQFRTATSAVPPATPDGLTALAESWDRITLAWNDNATDETGYVVQRSVNGGTYADRATLALNSTEFADTGLTGSTKYSYRVRAYNGAGVSDYTGIASATTASPPPPPAAPTPAQVGPSSTATNTWWTDVANESGYEVVRETYDSRKGSWSATTLKTGTNVTSMKETLASGTYRYKTRSVGPSGTSSYVINQCSTCASDGTFSIASTTTTSTKGVGKGRKW